MTMTKHNRHMEEVLEQLRSLANKPYLSAHWRKLYGQLLDKALNAQHDYEMLIQELQTQLLRNPEFPGDEMGRWLDDHERDDPADEDDDEKPAST
jgi:hypothetical protein